MIMPANVYANNPTLSPHYNEVQVLMLLTDWTVGFSSALNLYCTGEGRICDWTDHKQKLTLNVCSINIYTTNKAVCLWVRHSWSGISVFTQAATTAWFHVNKWTLLWPVWPVWAVWRQHWIKKKNTKICYYTFSKVSIMINIYENVTDWICLQ